MKMEEYTPKQILIFEGVMELLRQGRPLHELKVADIAEASGMGKSTAYEYFKSKDEILREALSYHMKEYFRQMVVFVFKAESLEGVLGNALEYLEESLEKRLPGIFLMMINETHEHSKTGPYMDPILKDRMEEMTTMELERTLQLGKEEGIIGEDMTLQDMKMVIMGFFTAYFHELLPYKMALCGRKELPDLTDLEKEDFLKDLKNRTLKLILKALA